MNTTKESQLEVIDPHNNKAYYLKRSKSVEGVSPENEKIILKYLRDMEFGRNVATKKGERSYSRLNAIYTRMKRMAVLIEQEYKKNIVEIDDLELMRLFKMMRDGDILTKNGKVYRSTRDYVMGFKAFWHWYQRVIRKEERADLPDITQDLDTSKEKPKFTYFTFDEMKKMAKAAKEKYRVLMWFLFDSGIRAPKELMNVRVKDIQELDDSSGLQLNIRDESSKTFGRKIKLLLCREHLLDYIESNDLSGDDPIFQFSPSVANLYLSRLCKRELKKEGLTMYDFRHASACYWLPIYKNESAMKYRFGWIKSEMIHYYTEFMGMKDTLQEDDLYVDTTKTQLEQQLESQKKKVQLMEEELVAMREQQKQDFAMLVELLKSKDFSKEESYKSLPIFKRVHEQARAT